VTASRPPDRSSAGGPWPCGLIHCIFSEVRLNIAATRLLALFVLVFSCADGAGAGSTKVTETIDPNLPREDPASYPDYPIVSTPSVFDTADASVDAATDVANEEP
jgi:hypothetical protein